MARKISIHRATTVSPKSPLCNVIVRNTSLEKDLQASATATINRSQSLLAKGRVPVLAPSRGDRARLEALLSDVWTREVLPFPGMTVRARNEHLIRTSAHSMIRKLSVTSITSQFTKRSTSLASVTRGGSEEDFVGSDDASGQESPFATTSETEPALDTHFGNASGCSMRLSIIEDNSDRTASTLRAESPDDQASSIVSLDGSLEMPRSPRRPRRRMRIVKSPGTGQPVSGSTRLSVPPSQSTPVALRARSANGPQINRQTSMLSRQSARSICSTADGARRGARNRRAAPADMAQFDGAADHVEDRKRSSSLRFSTPPPVSTSPSKAGATRWSRVEMLKRGSVAQGIRGFFR